MIAYWDVIHMLENLYFCDVQVSSFSMFTELCNTV